MAMEIAEKRKLKVAPLVIGIAEKRDIKSSTNGNGDRGEKGH